MGILSRLRPSEPPQPPAIPEPPDGRAVVLDRDDVKNAARLHATAALMVRTARQNVTDFAARIAELESQRGDLYADVLAGEPAASKQSRALSAEIRAVEDRRDAAAGLLRERLPDALRQTAERYTATAEAAGREEIARLYAEGERLTAEAVELETRARALRAAGKAFASAGRSALDAGMADARPKLTGLPAEVRERILNPQPGEWFDLDVLDDLDKLGRIAAKDPHPHPRPLVVSYDPLPGELSLVSMRATKDSVRRAIVAAIDARRVAQVAERAAV